MGLFGNSNSKFESNDKQVAKPVEIPIEIRYMLVAEKTVNSNGYGYPFYAILFVDKDANTVDYTEKERPYTKKIYACVEKGKWYELMFKNSTIIGLKGDTTIGLKEVMFK